MLKDLFNKPVITFSLKDAAKVFLLYQGVTLLLSVAQEKYPHLAVKKKEEE